MMLKILLNNFFRDIACTPSTISGRPKVIAPISFCQMRKLLLKQARRTTFQASEQICKGKARRVFNVIMNVVFADYAFPYSDIFGITNLNQQVPTSNFNVTLQNVITIFREPNYMRCQSAFGMRRLSIFFHLPFFSTKV
jgi:hypothetical protein